MKQVLLAALVLAVLSLAPAAGAQTTILPMTVDGVNVSSSAISVTGVVQGDSQPTTHVFGQGGGSATEAQKAAALDRCHRSLLLALAKPGQYLAKIGYETCTIVLISP